MNSQFYSSPIGALVLTARAGRLVGVRFAGENEQAQTSSYIEPEDKVVLDHAAEQLDEYFAGHRQRFDVPIALEGSAFQVKVWSTLYRIPFGKRVSYQQVAQAMDRGCSRSVGAANGANPLPIFIPCHRVVESDGGLGGYAGGTDAKRTLLDLEHDQSGLFAAAG